ncbi:OmpW/AlkL family protein [Herbaspirillum rubrisubalbicans]|uniref:OmpW/AlkL family protein n=1 Tax=Herbaspirillum rubrisubalbicans TaxID=80842 RepID=UPI0020A685F3|nr:OmpW family outer membrane protein [Herbaspirillum rubrisubalbicans]
MKIITMMPMLVVLALQMGNASAQQSPWSVYGGLAHIAFSPTAHVRVNGVEVPGGNANASSNDSLAFGVVYRFDEHWSAELALGLPPTTTLTGSGTLSSAGTLGKVKYGPAVLSLRHTFFAGAPVQPYIGAGLNYTHVFNSQDGFVQGLKTRSAFGPVLQLGVNVPFNEHWSLVLDVKKIWASTTATGTLPAFGGSAASADVRLDPLVSTLALSYRF